MRPNPDAPRDVLGLGEPAEWRSEPGLWTDVVRIEGELLRALAALDPDLPADARTYQRDVGPMLWPFHVDAVEGQLTVEWWGVLDAPVIRSVVYGDEVAELVAAYGAAPENGAQRRAIRRAKVWGPWFRAEQTHRLVEDAVRFGATTAVARVAIAVARAVVPVLGADLPRTGEPRGVIRAELARLVLDDAELALPDWDDRAAASLRDSAGSFARIGSEPADAASRAVREAVRAAASALPGSDASDLTRRVCNAVAEGEAAGGREVRLAAARLLRRLVPFAQVVRGAVRAYDAARGIRPT